jgi:uncharacterized protein YbjT (DUF2867 family)
MPVLVLGSTGNIGPHVVGSLRAEGAEVRVLARDAERARAILPATVEVVAGDPADDHDLHAALEGVKSLFLLSSHAFTMAEIQLRVIRSLRRSSVKIVKLSGTSSAVHPDGPHAVRQHWEVEEILTRSGQPYVILRPNSFMQVLIGQIMLPALRATGSIPNPVGTAGISFIDARDVGEVAAKVLVSDRWDGQTLVLTGPRAVTYAEIARLVSHCTGREIGLIETDPAGVRASLVARGMEAWEAGHFQEMYQLFREGESEFVTDTVERVTGHAPRTVEDYITENAAAFTGATK